MRQMGMLHTQNTHILGTAVVCTSFCGKIHQLPLRMERETVYTVPSHYNGPFQGHHIYVGCPYTFVFLV